MSINCMLNMAYDFYTHDQIAAVVNAAYGTGTSPRGGLKTTQYQAEDFDLDEALFLRKADYPTKVWTGPPDADELHFYSIPLSKISLVRGFVV